MLKRLGSVIAGLGILFSISNRDARAVNVFWDNNGASPATSGVWDNTSSFWATSSALTATPVTFTNGNFPEFAAGTTAISNMTITVNSAVTSAGMATGLAGATVSNVTFSGTGSISIPTNGGTLINGGYVQGFFCGPNGNDSLIFNIPITGAGGIEQESSGSMQLNASNSYAGGTDLTGGQLIFYNNNSAFGTGPITVNGTGNALVSGTTTPVIISNNLIFPTAGFNINLAGGNPTGTNPGTIFAGTVTMPASGSQILLNTSSTATQLIQIAGPISGGVTVTVADLGTMQFAGTNTYTGPTTITNTATLNIIGSGSLGSGTYAGKITNASTFIYSSSVNQTLSGVISGVGKLIANGPGTLTLSAVETYTNTTTTGATGVVTISGSGSLNSGSYAGKITNNGTINYNSSAAQTLSGVISGGGALTKGTSTSTLTLSGANTSTGPITINAGLLAFASDGNLGAVPGSVTPAAVTLNGGPNSGLRETANNITMNANRGITLGASGGEIQVAQNDTFTYPGVISGSGPFQDGQNSSTGLGVLILSGVNTYTNATTVACGTLRIAASGSIASSSGITISNASTLDVSAFSTYALGSATFTGIGGATTTTTILGAPGGTVDFGSQPITLSFVPTLATGDPTNAALTVSQATLNLNGNTFNVTNASALALGIGNYTLIQQTSGNISASGSFTLNLFGTALAPNTTPSLVVQGGALILSVQPAGGNTNVYFSNLTTNQSASYGTLSATVSGTVQAAGPVYPTNGSPVNVIVGGVTNTATVNDNTGDFSFTSSINTIPVGNYMITYTFAGDTNVPIGAASDTSTMLSITKAPVTVTASNQSKIYGQVITTGAGSTSFSASGLQNGDTIGSVTIAINGSGATATGSVAGSPYNITPSAATGGTFAAGNYTITYATGTLTVNPTALSVTANAQSKTYGQNVNFGSGSTAFTSVGLSNSETIGSVTLACSGGVSNASVSGSPYTITPSAATGGTFNITNYNVTYNTNLLTVNPATLTVTANNTNMPFGANLPTFTASYSGFVNAETLGTSDVGGSPALTTGATSSSDVGTYAITNSTGTLTSTNYSFSLVNGTLTITNAQSSNVVAGSPNPALPAAPVTFTATLTALSPSLAVPTNTVQFLIDSVPAGGPVSPVAGVAAITNSSLSHGYHTIEADYAGDTNGVGATNIVGSTNTVMELINTPPVAGTATYQRAANSNLVVLISNLLTNATDADGDTITLVSVSSPSTNGATVTSDGTNVTYVPPATNGNVTDAFLYTVADSFGATNQGTVIVTVTSPAGPANITGVGLLPNKTINLSFSGTVNSQYLVEATTNLHPPATWTTLSTNNSGPSGLFQYNDSDSTNHQQRYYRSSTP